jgi:hypothetical protein
MPRNKSSPKGITESAAVNPISIGWALSVADHLSFRGAARELGVRQTAVSCGETVERSFAIRQRRDHGLLVAGECGLCARVGRSNLGSNRAGQEDWRTQGRTDRESRADRACGEGKRAQGKQQRPTVQHRAPSTPPGMEVRPPNLPLPPQQRVGHSLGCTIHRYSSLLLNSHAAALSVTRAISIRG